MIDSTLLSRRSFLGTMAGASAALAAGSQNLFGASSPQAYKILGFTKPFQTLSFEETAETVAEIGWDGIECPVRPGGQIEPERASEDLPKLIESLKKRGKEIGIISTGITSAAQKNAEPLLRTAAKLGIKRYRLGSWKYDLRKPIADQVKAIAASLRDLAALNGEIGIQGGFQNHSGRDYVGAPVWDIWTMIRDLDPQHMGICFDIGHATLEGGSSWPIEANLMQKHLTAVFVKDFRWQRAEKGWRSEWVMLGEGMVNPSFVSWLKTTNFSGPISQHQEYDHGSGKPMIAKMQKDLQVLKGWLAAGG